MSSWASAAKLTEPEYEVVKTHPGIGATLIQEHPLGDLALSAVHQHHEWVNGQGYPGRLQGDQISIFAPNRQHRRCF